MYEEKNACCAGKGSGSLVSFAVLMGIVVMSIGILLSSGSMNTDVITSSVDAKIAEGVLQSLDNSIREVAREGANSSRIVTFTTTRLLETIPEEDAVEIAVPFGLIDYLSRQFRGSFVYIGGNDVSCIEEDANSDGVKDIVMENSYIKAVFNKVNKTSPMQLLDTSKNILMLIEKTGGKMLVPKNTSIVIDGDQSTSQGVGYSEIVAQGRDKPVCFVHFFVDSVVNYDVYYKLYAGADFIVVEVRNIR